MDLLHLSDSDGNSTDVDVRLSRRRPTTQEKTISGLKQRIKLIHTLAESQMLYRILMTNLNINLSDRAHKRRHELLETNFVDIFF